MRHRGGAPNALELLVKAKARTIARRPKDGPTFSAEELAFFWEPRRWIPDIRDRFASGRSGSSDIRDAIIAADDEGGDGFLHWYKETMSWGLTHTGRQIVTLALSSRRLRRILRENHRETVVETLERMMVEEPKLVEGLAKADEAREDEIARLLAEQLADDE